MDEEMMAALGAAETVDPVSGNDVPPGSMPEEVRDDIDARLSEGEYVVPADVVRFFGVRVFEEMRKEAKMGLAQMDADGRIGGKPSTEQPMGNDGISDEEVAQLEQMLSAQGMADGGLAQGGMLEKLVNAATTDPMVNERMQAAGMPVKMAVGGVVGQQMPSQSLYSDPTKVDNVIAQVANAAQQNPDLMRILGERGITVPTVTATQTPDQMALANSPKETTNPVMKDAKSSTVSAANGTLAYPNMPDTSGFVPSASVPMAALAPYAMGPGVSTVLGAAGATAPISAPTPVPAPAVAAPTEPAGGCGTGKMWNGMMCVVDPNFQTGKTNEDGPEPEPITNWYDDVDFTDPVGYIDSTIAEGSKPKGGLESIIGMTGLGKMVQNVDALTDVARMNASVQLSVASGQMTQKEADAQIEKISGYAESQGLKQGVVDTFASGTKFANKNKRDADKAGDGDGEATPEEIADWMDNNGAGAGKRKPKVATSTVTPVSVQPKDNKSSSDDPPPTFSQAQDISSGRGRGSRTTKQKAATNKQIAGMTNASGKKTRIAAGTTTGGKSRLRQRKEKEQKDRRGGGGGKAEGGLMKRK